MDVEIDPRAYDFFTLLFDEGLFDEIVEENKC